MLRASRERTGAAIEPVYTELGKWLAAERKRLGLSQQDVSVMLRLSRPSIANIEAGKQRLMHHQVLEMRERVSDQGAAEYFAQHLSTVEEDAILEKAAAILARRELETQPNDR